MKSRTRRFITDETDAPSPLGWQRGLRPRRCPDRVPFVSTRLFLRRGRRDLGFNAGRPGNRAISRMRHCVQQIFPQLLTNHPVLFVNSRSPDPSSGAHPGEEDASALRYPSRQALRPLAHREESPGAADSGKSVPA